MQRALFAIPVCVFLCLPATAWGQASAKVPITIRISAQTPSFTGARLVVMLFHDHPTQPDRGDSAVDSRIDRAFSHRQGKETVVSVVLGENAKLNPAVQYSVNATVFGADNKLTHAAVVDDQRGPFPVITNGAPATRDLSVRPVP